MSCHDDISTPPPTFERRRLTTNNSISRLDPAASARAVYASPRESPHADARLASGCRLGSTGWDWLPTEFDRKVSSDAPTSLSQASPGAINSTFALLN